MPHILVVDDDSAVLRYVENALTGFGYEVSSADSGEAAIRRFEVEGAYDLLLTDYVMPGMRGDELARTLRDRQPWLKIVFLTGFGPDFYAAHPDISRKETTIEKPFTLAELHDAVSLAIYGHRGGPPRA